MVSFTSIVPRFKNKNAHVTCTVNEFWGSHQQSAQRTRPARAEAPSRFVQSCPLVTLTPGSLLSSFVFFRMLCERVQPTGTLLCLTSFVQHHVLRFVHVTAFIFKTAEEYLLCGHTVFCFYL